MPIRSAIRGAAALAILTTAPGCFLSSLINIVDTVSRVTRSAEDGDPYSVDGYAVAPARKSGLAAGAGTADITPPPGFPTGGHGPAGDVARGYWMRLRSRAFFFEDGSGRALVLVSADLFAVPGGLRQRVGQLAVEELAQEKIAVSLPPEAVIIAATHTHHGPGNFMTARVYNQFGSSYPGFSSDLFQFLARGIAHSVADAVRSARRGQGSLELTVHAGRVPYGFLRNRAPKTFMLNRDREAILERLSAGDRTPTCAQDPEEPPDGWEGPDCPRLRAVDRALTVLEVKRGGSPIADLVFFAAHPTDLPADTPFYSSDFAGAAMLSLEQQLGTVVGFFNGAEGDVTLRRHVRDLREAAHFGDELAKEVNRVLYAGQPVSVESGVHVRAHTWQAATEGACKETRLSPTPVFGTATYASYCASRDEYWAQDYMGASTLWGPNEGAYLACRLRELAAMDDVPAGAAVAKVEFHPGVAPETPFGFAFAGGTQDPDDGLAELLLDGRKRPARDLPWFSWLESEREPPFDRAGQRTVELLQKNSQGSFETVENDRLGSGLLTIYHGAANWSAIWVRPILRPGVSGEFAFVATFKDSRECSAPFPFPRNGLPNGIERGKCDALAGAGKGRR